MKKKTLKQRAGESSKCFENNGDWLCFDTGVFQYAWLAGYRAGKRDAK